MEVPEIDIEAAKRLRRKLRAGTDNRAAPDTLASSLRMREIRLKVIGEVLRAFDTYRDDELLTFTAINRKWLVTPAQLDRLTAAAVKNQFRTHLKRAGVLDIPGPLVAFVHGEFEPTSRTYQLHLHGAGSKDKVAALDELIGQWGYVPTMTGADPVRREAVNDRNRQLSYPLKSYWPQKAVRKVDGGWKRDRRVSRIDDPFQAQVLLWLDRQTLNDIMILNGCRFMPNGKLVVT